MEPGCDLDCDKFSVDIYVKRIIKDFSLNKLLEKENELKKEIKLLDNDMQSLVYENYNKFINATDIVQNLKFNFDNIESMIKNVSTKMDNIIVSHNNLLQDMKPNKEKMLEYSSVSEELKKMQCIFDLPAYLQTLYKEQKFTHLFNEYLKSSHIFSTHKDMKTFEDINTECRTIIHNVYGYLIGNIKFNANILKTPLELYEAFDILKRILENKCLDLNQSNDFFDVPTTPSTLALKYIEICTNYSELEILKYQEIYCKINTHVKDYMSFADDVNENFLKNFGNRLIFYKILFDPKNNGFAGGKEMKECNSKFESNAQYLFQNFCKDVVNTFYLVNFENQKNTYPVLDSYEMVFAKSLDKIFRKVCNITLTLCNAATDANEILSSLDDTGTKNPFSSHDQGVPNPMLLHKKRMSPHKPEIFPNVDLKTTFSTISIVPVIFNRIEMYRYGSSEKLEKFLSEIATKLIKIDENSKIIMSGEDTNLLCDMASNLSTSVMEHFKCVLKKLQCYSNQEDLRFIEEPILSESLLKYGIFGRYIFPILRYYLDILKTPIMKPDVNQVKLVTLFHSKISINFNFDGYDNLITFAHDCFRTIPRPISATMSTPVGNVSSKPQLNDITNTFTMCPVVDRSVFAESAQDLLNCYVQSIAFVFSRGIEHRFALPSLKLERPASVTKCIADFRVHMERIDLQVNQLYPSAPTFNRFKPSSSSHSSKDRRFNPSSMGDGGSSRATGSQINFVARQKMIIAGGANVRSKPTFSSTFSNRDNHYHNDPSSLLSNHISKLFSEKIVFYENVDFNPQSILSSIVKICLKSLLEQIRLQTLNTTQFQQIQIDSHYLLLYMWKYVSNEKILQTLLDEIIASAMLRCTDPIFLNQEVLDQICDREASN